MYTFFFATRFIPKEFSFDFKFNHLSFRIGKRLVLNIICPFILLHTKLYWSWHLKRFMQKRSCSLRILSKLASMWIQNSKLKSSTKNSNHHLDRIKKINSCWISRDQFRIFPMTWLQQKFYHLYNHRVIELSLCYRPKSQTVNA